MEKFRKYCSKQQINLGDDCSASVMDHALAAYFEDSFDRGKGVSLATSTLCAVLYFYPRFHNRLGIAHQAWRGWKKRRPTTHHPPISWELVVLIACTMCRDYGFHVGLLVLLSVDCYLRPREALALSCDDIFILRRDGGTAVSPSSSHSAAHAATAAVVHEDRVAVRIRKGKTDENATLCINNADVARLVLMYYRVQHGSRRSSTSFFGVSYYRYRKCFRAVCDSMQLPASVVLHSLRHSGATMDYFRHQFDFARVKERGRWRKDKTVRIYLGVAESLMNDLRVQQQFVHSGAKLAQHIAFFFEQVLSSTSSSLLSSSQSSSSTLSQSSSYPS